LITPRDIEDQQLAERYLADQLGPIEQAELEQYYSEHPGVLQDLQAVAGIKMGLALLRATGELERLNAPRKARWMLVLAAAATLLVAVLTGYLLRTQLQPPAVIAATASALSTARGVPLRVHSTYDLQRTRSDVDVTIVKPATPGPIELRLRDALDPPPAVYGIELLAIQPGDTRSSRAKIGGLRADDSGLLNLYLDPAALGVGSFELRLFRETSRDAAPGSRQGSFDSGSLELSDFLIDIVAEGPEA
jgi:hypothetical protein